MMLIWEGQIHGTEERKERPGTGEGGRVTGVCCWLTRVDMESKSRARHGVHRFPGWGETIQDPPSSDPKV